MKHELSRPLKWLRRAVLSAVPLVASIGIAAYLPEAKSGAIAACAAVSVTVAILSGAAFLVFGVGSFVLAEDDGWGTICDGCEKRDKKIAELDQQADSLRTALIEAHRP